MDQEIRFATSPDGTRIAYAVHGSGPPLVRTAHWLTHLEYDWGCPVWRHWLETLGRSFRVIRYDERRCGLSDREIGTPTVDDFIGDLEAVVEAAGLTAFRPARHIAGRCDRGRARQGSSTRLPGSPSAPWPRRASSGSGRATWARQGSSTRPSNRLRSRTGLAGPAPRCLR